MPDVRQTACDEWATAERSFHDAEILAVQLDREGPAVELVVEVLSPERQTLRLRFDQVTDVELGGLNEQNVLFDLKAVPAGDGLLDIRLESTYGLGGRFRCASISTR